jgi:low affinity Fe/Cu permease
LPSAFLPSAFCFLLSAFCFLLSAFWFLETIMKSLSERRSRGWMERFAQSVTGQVGRSWAFTAALLTTLIWIACGPLFHYSDTWQLVWNTVTSVVTFLMVFLIQRSQNKESLAIQLKLNELVAAVAGASNRLIDIEGLSEADLATLHSYYKRLAAIAARDSSMTSSHSVEEAERRHAARVTVHQVPGEGVKGQG